MQDCFRSQVTEDDLRTVRRPRKYVHRRWLVLLRPLFAYNYARNAYLLRFVGARFGPVLKVDRRARGERDRRPWVDRSSAQLAPRLESGDGIEPRRASPA